MSKRYPLPASTVSGLLKAFSAAATFQKTISQPVSIVCVRGRIIAVGQLVGRSPQTRAILRNPEVSGKKGRGMSVSHLALFPSPLSAHGFKQQELRLNI